MPNKIRYFAQTPDGNILVTTGFDAVQKWNGLSSSIGLAGVPQPATAIVVAASSEGGIMGTITAYQRYLDIDGVPGPLSPISNEYTIASNSGSITAASNASPIVITSASHGLSTNDFVDIRGVTGNISANGKWTITVLTANTFSLNNSAGAGDYDAGGTWRQGAGQVNYTSVDAPSDSRVVTRQILRTKDGDANALYIDVETTDLSSTSFNSTNDDDDLGFNPIPLFDASGSDNATSKYDEPPDYKPFMAFLNGRMFGTGDLTYGHGAAVVTNGSATVTGIDTEWTTEMAGREFWIVGSTAKYTISAVTESTQTITLTANYTGTTNQYARYAIRMPIGYRRSVEYSAALYPESWDPANSVDVPEDRNAGEITGIVVQNRWNYILADFRMWRQSFQTDPVKDGYIAPAPQRGCVNHRCTAVLDDYVAMLDRRGVYEFGGNDMRETGQAVQAAWAQDSDCPWRINWRWAKYFHVVNDPESDIIRWFVSLTGRYPRHCFAYSRRTRAWWVEEYPFGVPSSCLGQLAGRRQVYLGAEGRQVIAINLGTTDGPATGSGTMRGTCTSAGMTWVADTSATFPSSGLVNTALHIVSGKGKGQWRKIVSVSGTTINVDMPFASVPDTTSVYQLGGIGWRWRTGDFRWVANDRQNPRAVEVTFVPTTSVSRLAVSLHKDRSATPYTWGIDKTADENRGVAIATDDAYMEIDTTKANGFVRQTMDGGRESEVDGWRFVSVGMTGVTNAERLVINEVNLEGASGG